jgi:hypothetical protein
LQPTSLRPTRKFRCLLESTAKHCECLARLFVEQVEAGEYFGFQMFPPLGPFEPSYDSGIRAALGLLQKGQGVGQHEAQPKWLTVRKARAVHTNVHQTVADNIQGALVWRSEKSRFVATAAPTDSVWFLHFMTGARARVGERLKQDAAISISIMKAMQEMLEREWEAAEAASDHVAKLNTAEHAAFFLCLYCGSLRGFEGPKVVLHKLRRQIVTPGSPATGHTPPHIALPLTGRFKARSQNQRHILIPVAYETNSGLKPGVWVQRLIDLLADRGITTGWLFRMGMGEQKRMTHFEERFYDLLLRVQQTDPTLFPSGTEILEDQGGY